MEWWIVGTGGHARKACHAIAARGEVLLGFLDENPVAQSPYLGVSVYGPTDWPSPREGECVYVAIGRAEVRRRLMDLLEAAGWSLPPLVHPRAWVAPDVVLANGVFVAAQAAVESAARVGRGSIVDTGSVVDHDACIDDFFHLRSGVVGRPGERLMSET